MAFDDTITISRSHYAGGPCRKCDSRRLGTCASGEIGRGDRVSIRGAMSAEPDRAVKFLSGPWLLRMIQDLRSFGGARSAATLHRTGLTTITAG